MVGHELQLLKEGVDFGAVLSGNGVPSAVRNAPEPVRRLTQAQPEVADAKAGEHRFDAVDEPRLLCDQSLTLAAWPRASSSASVGIAAMLQ